MSLKTWWTPPHKKHMKKIKEIIPLQLIAMYFFFTGDISFLNMLYVFFPSLSKTKNGIPTLFGKPFLTNGNIGDFLGLLRQVVKKNQYHIELIKDGDIIIDAGANMGIFSIFVAHTYPNATIYAFEPTPSTFAILKENVKYYPNIKISDCGLGESEKIASVIIVGGSGGTGGENYIGEGGVPIEIKTIDSLNMRVDFLKMDVEGYEANILKGARETIKKYKPVVAMSAYHKLEDKKELPILLKSICPEYVCELHHDCDEDFICHCD